MGFESLDGQGGDRSFSPHGDPGPLADAGGAGSTGTSGALDAAIGTSQDGGSAAVGDGGADSQDAGTGNSTSDGGRSTSDGGRSTDAATPDADSGTGGNTCPAAGIFCDGFEQGLVSWDQTTQQAGNAGQISSPSHSGSYSLEATTDSATGNAYVTRTGLGPYTSGLLYVRGYFYVPADHTLTSYEVLSVASSSPADDAVSVMIADGKFALYTVAQDVFRAGSSNVPLAQWFCLEFDVDIRNNGGRTTLRVDGVEDNFLSGIDSLPPDGFSQLSVGITWSRDDQLGAHVFVDDVVVSRSPIGC